jgi:NADH-quinone oxidoreductase subunit C
MEDNTNQNSDKARPDEKVDTDKPDVSQPKAPAEIHQDHSPAGDSGETPQEPSEKPTLPLTEKPAPPKAAGSTAGGSGKTPPEAPAKPTTSAAEKPAPPKAAPPAGHKPAPPAKKGPVITVDITGDALIDRIRERFGEAITEAVATLGQQILRVKKDSYVELCNYLHDDQETLFDMCTDLTAIHWPDRSGQEFDLVILLYSVPKNRRLRVKVSLADGEACPSVTPIWAGADWMEREVFDMFGIRFEGHPDLRRILLPEDWPGHPLRKEYPIEYRDNEWTDKHLDYREIDYDTSLIDVKYAERR